MSVISMILSVYLPLDQSRQDIIFLHLKPIGEIRYDMHTKQSQRSEIFFIAIANLYLTVA